MIDEAIRIATWEWRVNVLKKMAKENKTNLKIRYLQRDLIRLIEKDLENISEELYCKDRVLEEHKISIECCDKND